MHRLPGLITQVGVLESDVIVLGVELDGLGELVARGLGLADFQQRVGEIFSDRRILCGASANACRKSVIARS